MIFIRNNPELQHAIEESVSLHKQAWKHNDKFFDYLDQAIALLQSAYDSNPDHALVINNYAAVLLDRHRDDEALKLLQKRKPEFSELCENYAIALTKTHNDISLIRKWNQEARNLPKNANAIVAYLDYHGL